jgi:hypothetical protein
MQDRVLDRAAVRVGDLYLGAMMYGPSGVPDEETGVRGGPNPGAVDLTIFGLETSNPDPRSDSPATTTTGPSAPWRTDLDLHCHEKRPS